MQNNFQFEMPTQHSTISNASLEPLPSLSGVKRISFDTETTVEEDFYSRSLSGISYFLPDGRKGYIPIRHPNSANHTIENVRAWAKNELKNKELIVANGKHELITMEREGIDFESLNIRLRDVFHQGALVDDHRKTIMQCDVCKKTYAAFIGVCPCGSTDGSSIGRLNLHVLALEELGHHMIDADHSRLWDMPAEQVAPIAIEDVEVTWRLFEHFNPKIEAEELQDVLDLEDNLIYATAEMERNGAYLDVTKMMVWKAEIQAERERRIMDIWKATGLKINTGSWKGMQRLFEHLKLDYPRTDHGTPSFPEEFMVKVPHPIAQLALECRQLKSVVDKYFDPYSNAVRNDGLLRYSLHQLAGDRYGTITGRYSASNENIQQVPKNAKQPLLLQRWPIRALFVPGPGDDGWLSGDASQIEFRFFAHYAAKFGMNRLADRYHDNPWVDFHNMIVEWTGLIRDHAKNVNFCKLYGGGAEKIAFMMNLNRNANQSRVTEDQVYNEIIRPYEREFPEANRLMNMASRQAEEQGFVRTILGRRRRFGKHGERFYSALNCVLQGGAAEIMKKKLLELYRQRKRLGLTMRFTVHDEFDGGLRDRAYLPEVTQLLNAQTTPMNVPILWEVKVGDNWHDAH